MTRKDFELIASAIRESKATGTPVEQVFVGKLLSTNPRFNADRFFAACKVEK